MRPYQPTDRKWKGDPKGLPFFFMKNAFSTKGKTRVVSLNIVDKMLNAFTMHSFLLQCLGLMLLPCLLALVRFSFTYKETIQFTYLLTKIIHYEKESIFFDDDAFARLYGCGKG